MNIPEKVKIGGHIYAVDLVSPNEVEGNNGVTWLKLQKILIDKDVPKDRQDSVLIHEIIEVINNDYELELPHRTIQCLEEVLHQVIKDNPSVFGDSDAQA